MWANQSVVKPRKQKPSEIKQEIAEIGGDILKLSADIAESTARLQKKIIDEITQLAEGTNSSFFAKATGEQLATHRDELLKLRDCHLCMLKEQETRVYNLAQSIVINK
jgi:hypothetical protein